MLIVRTRENFLVIHVVVSMWLLAFNFLFVQYFLIDSFSTPVVYVICGSHYDVPIIIVIITIIIIFFLVHFEHTCHQTTPDVCDTFIEAQPVYLNNLLPL